MQRLFKWFLILNKRLYKKWAFVAILAFLLVSVCFFSFAAAGDSGFVHIVLAQNNNGDAVSSEIVNKLLGEESMILFTKAETPAEAIRMIETGAADSAWIFPDKTGEAVSEFVDNKNDGFVRVIEREQNVFLRLSREKLNAVLYDYSAKAFFINYTRENIAQLSSLSDEELLEFFDSAKISEELFVFGNPSAADLTETPSDNYLTAPLRGLLGVITVLGGMAAALYYMQDEKNQTFAWVPQKNRLLVGIGCIAVATLNISVISMISLCVSGLYRFSVKEVICAVTFSVCCATFCMLLKQILGNVKVFGSVIPVLITVIICVCPVFFIIKQIRIFSFLFPPTYYINAANNNKYIVYMLIYSAVCFCLCFVLQKLRKSKV